MKLWMSLTLFTPPKIPLLKLWYELHYLLNTLVYEPGYTYYKLRECDGRNELYIGSVGSREECSTKCNDKNNCISFEWWGKSNPHPSKGKNYCQASSSCSYDLSKISSSTDLFVKGDNIQFTP